MGLESLLGLVVMVDPVVWWVLWADGSCWPGGSRGARVSLGPCGFSGFGGSSESDWLGGS